MVTSTAVLVRCQDPDDLAERAAVAGFLAGYTGSTRVSYTTDLRLFAEWCAGNGVRLLAVKRAHVELFARHMEANGRMRSTVARRLSTLTGFYRYCHVEGLLRRHPAANVRRPRVDHESRTLGLDRNELDALLVQAGLGSPRDHALIALLALNGLRISEALGADVTDLDVERGHRTLRIVRKGGKHVTIPLAPRTARALDLYVAERTVGAMFLTVDGHR
jgi:integrase/recombinase XerD